MYGEAIQPTEGYGVEADGGASGAEGGASEAEQQRASATTLLMDSRDPRQAHTVSALGSVAALLDEHFHRGQLEAFAQLLCDVMRTQSGMLGLHHASTRAARANLVAFVRRMAASLGADHPTTLRYTAAAMELHSDPTASSHAAVVAVQSGGCGGSAARLASHYAVRVPASEQASAANALGVPSGAASETWSERAQDSSSLQAL